MKTLTVYHKCYDLLVWIFNKTDGFPKSKRFSIGQRLETCALDLVLLLNEYQFAQKHRGNLDDAV